MGNEFFNDKHKEALKALDKHLRDNVITHHESEFKQTEGPRTYSVTTVAYRKNKGNNEKFVQKSEDIESTVVEAIAGNLYKVLLYDRSPTFKLVEASDVAHPRLKLQSNLLSNFITLCEFINDKSKKKFIDLVYEKFASTNGQKELTIYMFASLIDFARFKDYIERIKSETEGHEEFFISILEQLEGKYPYTRIVNFPEFEDIPIQIFSRFKNDRKYIEELFLGNLNEGIEVIIRAGPDVRQTLERILNGYCNKDHYNEAEVESIKKCISDLIKFNPAFYTIAGRLNQKEFSEELLIEILEEVKEEVKKAKEIKKQLNSYASQELKREVGGLEKIITSMMLFGYSDLHGSNIGIMDIEHENRDGSKTTEKVYAKVDMSASFYNLRNTHYLDYLDSLRYIVLSSRAVGEESLNWHDTINYNKLKKEINKSCDLFIDRPEYVESLIHRALFYKKPLLKTEEELGLVSQLAKEIVTQAKLLKEFANSTEFTSLVEDRDNLQNCNYSTQRRKSGMVKTKESVIERIVAKVKGNLGNTNINPTSLVNNHRKNLGLPSSTHLNSTNENVVNTEEIHVASAESEILVINNKFSNSYTSASNSEQGSNIQSNCEKLSNLAFNTNTKLQVNNDNTPKFAMDNLSSSGNNKKVSSCTPTRNQASLLITGVIVGVCCLVPAAIIYYCNKPSELLENSSIEGFFQGLQQPTL